MAIPILLAGVGKDELTDSTSRRALLDALTGLPATTTAMACMSIATLLETMGEVLEASESPGFFLVWDSVIPHCLASEQAASSTGPPDHLLSSLNNPCGRVTAALLRLLARSPLSRDGGIASPFADRLKRVLHSSEPGAFYGRVLIASRLYLLSWLDLAWTESELIPFFSWSRSTEAVGAWQGFLWTPRMGNRLFHALRTDFVEAFSHLGELGDMGENLLGLLVALALDAPDRMAPAETRGCLRTIDTMARRRIAWLLAKRLQATEENKRSDLWLDRVDPWLQEHWPLETQYADGDTSDMLGWAATFTGNAFPRAVATIRRLLAPSHGSLMTLRALDENLLASQFPEDSLVLIDCLLDQSEERQHIGELGRLLDAIEEAQPSLASDERFRRLRNLARRHGRSRGR
jgi:hypothetical protein